LHGRETAKGEGSTGILHKPPKRRPWEDEEEEEGSQVQ